MLSDDLQTMKAFAVDSIGSGSVSQQRQDRLAKYVIELAGRHTTPAEPPLPVQDAEVEVLRKYFGQPRETLGRMVRFAWVRWAAKQPDPKPSWLVHWEHLPERDKEVDRQIGEVVQELVLTSPLKEIHLLRKLRASSSPATRDREVLAKWFKDVFCRGDCIAGSALNFADKLMASGLLAGGQWRPIDWMDIQTRITNFVRIEDDSEEWEGPNHHITGKKEATDAIAKLITDNGGKVVGP